MKIRVNQEDYDYPAQSSLLEVLKDLQKAERSGIAVAVNQTVVPKSNWASTKLQENDKIIIITATQGG